MSVDPNILSAVDGCFALKIIALCAVLALSLTPIVAAERDRGALEAVFDCWQPDRVFKQCAVAGHDGRPRLTPAYRSQLKFGSDGLAAIALLGAADTQKNQWFYVRRGGIPVPVESFDNGPDQFNDGLARSRVGGKTGYIDRRLNLVIPAKYDGAYPFEQGVAVVCQACAIVSDGEHSRYEGGQWGRIDRRGHVVTPFHPWRKGQ
jgi:hypothetical protein